MMLKEMIVEKSRQHKTAVYPLAAFAAASALAYSSAGLVTLPIMSAFSAALPPLCSAAFSLGGMLTLLTSGTIAENGFTFCSLILSAVGSFIMRYDKTARSSMFITLMSMAFSGIVFGFLVDRSAEKAVGNTVVSVIGALASYFIFEMLGVAGSKSKKFADKQTLTAFSAVFVLLVSMMCGLNVSLINIGIVCASAVVLCACRFFGAVGGAVCGVLASAGVTAAYPELGLQTVFFGAAGLAAGVVSSQKRVALTAVFSGINLLGQLAVGMDDMAFCVQADTVIGGAVFLLLPERAILRAGKFFSADTDERGITAKEIEFAARSLSDIRKSIDGFMDALSEHKRKDSIPFEVSRRVCGKCRCKLDCWEKNYERTNDVFIKIGQKRISQLSSASLGFECIRREKLSEEFEKAFRQSSFERMMKARVSENRSLLFSQMEASEEMMLSLSEKMSVNISKSMTSNLGRLLAGYNIENKGSVAYYTQSGRLIAEIYVRRGTQEGRCGELCRILSRELGVEFEYSAPFDCDDETRLRFNQKTKFKAECVMRQLCAREGEQSGDCCGFFTDGLGSGYICISDGMGSGKEASIDSEISLRLFKRFIRLGLNCEGAIKMINSLMLGKTGSESFATLDIARIDLETGNMTLYKSGASATLVKYDDAVVMYSLPSNPVGIIPDASFSKRECDFDEGDVIVMMSDGVPDTAYPYIKEQLGSCAPFEKMADNICIYSHKLTSVTMPDDVTVAVMKLVENC